MDPVTALGLASAIVTLMDVSIKVTRRIEELSSDGDVPEFFRDIKKRLPCIDSIVNRMKEDCENMSLVEQERYKDLVIHCSDQIQQVDEVLEKVTVVEGDSRFRRLVKVGVSMMEERHVHKIALKLRDNIQLLTFFNAEPIENGRPKIERNPSEPLPSSNASNGLFLVPFKRDEQFVGRESNLQSIALHYKTQKRAALSGIGGVG